MKKFFKSLVRLFASMEVIILTLFVLMILVVLCTLDQVNIGTFNAVDKYFREFFVKATLPGVGWTVPVFPGGGLVGFLLLLSLSAGFYSRFKLRKQKIGIWLTHFGLIVLVLGEFLTGMFAVESQMRIEEGASANYTTGSRIDELAVIDTSHPEHDTVYSVDDSFLKTEKEIVHKSIPFKIIIKAFFSNATFQMKGEETQLLPSIATQGVGTRLVVQPLPEVSQDNQRNLRTAFVELKVGEASLGIWLLSSGLAAPQIVEHDGKTFSLAIRPKRYYLPYTMTLKDFKHDLYPGTTIPKNFSSLIRLVDPEKNEDRDVLIYMNHPLRYRGKTFYQASFGKNDTLSILQVVANPGRHLPYISFILMGVGLLIHFSLKLRRRRT